MGRKGRKDSDDVADEQLPFWRRPGRSAILSLLSLIVLAILAVSGLERLRAQVGALPQYRPQPRLELVDPPQWVISERWEPQILESVPLPEQAGLLEGGLVRKVGESLQASGWIAKVKRVTQDLDGTVKASCEYRRPIAMIRTHKGDDGDYRFVAVDKDGIRLPQEYKNVGGAGWIQIIGVIGLEQGVPPPGERVTGEDAEAGIRLAHLLFQQDFATRVESVNVTNFRGRKDKRNNHILLTLLIPAGEPGSELTVDGRGNWRRQTYGWGSALGEEFEEPTPVEKLRNIANMLRSGRQHVSADNVSVDISVFSDRAIERFQPPVTADGSLTRDR